MPETVIVPLRDEVPVFGSQVTVTVPSLLPVPGLTDSQANDSDTVHEVLEVIENVLFSPPAAKLNEVGETLKAGAAPACVPETVRELTPVPDTVIVPLR